MLCVQLRSQLQVQISSLQVDYEAVVLRAEEESEASTQLRAQVSRLNSELAALKGKYDRELLQKSEEFEEFKCAAHTALCSALLLCHSYVMLTRPDATSIGAS